MKIEDLKSKLDCNIDKDIQKILNDRLDLEVYECGRCWSAWNHGTMGEDDFTMIDFDDIRDSIFNDIKNFIDENFDKKAEKE